MPWYTDNLGPMYAQTPYCIQEVSYNSFDDSVSFTLDCNGIDRETLMKQICGNLNLTKKETNKMEAKKCDRCGKLYEMPGAKENDGADVRFKHMRISGAEDMSGSKIAEKQTRRIWVKAEYEGDVDLCPECRKSLKKWFESTDKEEK